MVSVGCALLASSGSWGQPEREATSAHTTAPPKLAVSNGLTSGEQVPPSNFRFFQYSCRSRLQRGPLPGPAYFLLPAPPLAPLLPT